jgi:hypothetical protein
MIDLQINTSGLQAAIAEFARVSRKDITTVVRQQAGILVGHVIALTPPATHKGGMMTDTGGISLDAKKRGESSIAADIASIFPTTSLKDEAVEALIGIGHDWRGRGGRKMKIPVFAKTTEELRRVHQASRSPATGRTRQLGGSGMAVTRKAVLKQYIKQEQQKVGKLNAGWLSAGRDLKTAARAMPAWIRRHGERPGGSSTTNVEDRVSVRIFNSQEWFPGTMESRVRIALRRREIGLQKAVEAILERRAKAASARMR